MVKYPFLDLKIVNSSVEEELKAAANAVISSGRYILGENVTRLEDNLAQLCEVNHAVATSTGLDALRLIFRAYIEMGEMQPGDEVIVPANTFIASSLAVSDCGLIPVFADASPYTMNLDLGKVESYITPRTKAIMTVHLYGTPCWNEVLIDLREKYNLKIIEDNAQAIGAVAECGGVFGTNITGGLGDASAMSFYPTKNIGALGDAGAVTTNDADLSKVVRELLNYGSDRRYHNIYRGLNCRMDELQAAFINVKLPYLEAENEHRRALARTYNCCIVNPLIRKPLINGNLGQVWYHYVLQLDRRDEFREFMLKNGVETDVLYPVPLPCQPCYNEDTSNISQTVNLCARIVSIPLSSMISDEDAVAISHIVNRFE